MRTPFPRSRGGRGPQIGPGTFEGRTAGTPPGSGPFTAIVWNPGPAVPGIELWCIRTLPFHLISTGSTYLSLEKIAAEEQFVPPQGAGVSSMLTINSLKAFAQSRLFQEHQESNSLAEWIVLVGIPTPMVPSGMSKKIVDGVYRVAQTNLLSGDIPIAWVWVSGLGSREIWLYYKLGQEGGFQLVGTTAEGGSTEYTNSMMKFTRVDPAGVATWNTGSGYGTSISAFKTFAMNDTDSPVSDSTELLTHDLRITYYE